MRKSMLTSSSGASLSTSCGHFMCTPLAPVPVLAVGLALVLALVLVRWDRAGLSDAVAAMTDCVMILHRNYTQTHKIITIALTLVVALLLALAVTLVSERSDQSDVAEKLHTLIMHWWEAVEKPRNNKKSVN